MSWLQGVAFTDGSLRRVSGAFGRRRPPILHLRSYSESPTSTGTFYSSRVFLIQMHTYCCRSDTPLGTPSVVTRADGEKCVARARWGQLRLSKAETHHTK